MIKQIVIIWISFVVFMGCSSGDDDNKTTLYEGIVVYSDDQSPLTDARLVFKGMKSVSGIGQLDEVIIEREVDLGNDGTFRFELETTRSSIDYFGVNLLRGASPISIDCSPNSCASLLPRTTLTDLRFFAERE